MCGSLGMNESLGAIFGRCAIFSFEVLMNVYFNYPAEYADNAEYPQIYFSVRKK
jgi:hypothetical protein